MEEEPERSKAWDQPHAILENFGLGVEVVEVKVEVEVEVEEGGVRSNEICP